MTDESAIDRGAVVDVLVDYHMALFDWERGESLSEICDDAIARLCDVFRG
jgi:hypothetical protein